MKVRTYSCVGALALATLIPGACKSARVAETREIQTQRTKDFAIVLLNEKGELAMGQDRFIIAFRSAADSKPVDVGTVTVGSSMAMPGMAPMTAPIELEPAGTTGQYVAKGDFAMSGAWKFEVRWNGPAGNGTTSIQYQRAVTTMNLPLVFLTTFVLTVPIFGQREDPSVLDPAGQTVQDLVTRALAQNGEFLAGERLVAAARGGVTQARLKANPSLSLNESQEIAGRQNNFVIGGTLPLELYHRRERRVDVAQSGVKMTEFDQAERERLLRAEVETKFGEVLAAARNLQVVEDLLDLNRKALDLTQKRADLGAIPMLDANLLRVEVNRIDASRVDIDSKLGVGILELKSLVGMKPDEELRLKGSLEAVFGDPDVSIQRVLESRPDILSLRAAEQLASAKLSQAQTEARPDASISANYQRMDSSFNLNGLNALGQSKPIQGIFHFLTVGVSISLPVRNKNQGAIETALAQMDEARRRREYAELIATREVSAALLARDKAQEGLRIFRDAVRGQASQNLEVVRKTYELGRTQLLDVIAEQQRFIQIEMGYTEALNRYYQAAVRVRAVTGGK